MRYWNTLQTRFNGGLNKFPSRFKCAHFCWNPRMNGCACVRACALRTIVYVYVHMYVCVCVCCAFVHVLVRVWICASLCVCVSEIKLKLQKGMILFILKWKCDTYQIEVQHLKPNNDQKQQQKKPEAIHHGCEMTMNAPACDAIKRQHANKHCW